MVKHFKKISDYHKVANLPGPNHPLVSVINYSEINYGDDLSELSWRQDYYTIALKRNVPYKLFYGQQEYDFDEGIMTFIAPGQSMSLASNPNAISNHPIGFLLLIHPDFLWGSNLASKIKSFDFFDYSVREALFLSEKEEQKMLSILSNIQSEYSANIDQFSQNIIISQIELLLNYAERFYSRQFITRKISNHGVLSQLESILNKYIDNGGQLEKGLPSVNMLADQLNLTPNYLSGLLKSITGMSTQQHIQNKLIERAKQDLISSGLSVSQIAYQLGFEHPASFTKLFKKKTSLSPSEYRKQFN